jgi:hypothetical protein
MKIPTGMTVKSVLLKLGSHRFEGWAFVLSGLSPESTINETFAFSAALR